MIDLKTPQEIKAMCKGGKILHKILLELLDEAKAGVKLESLDKLAGKLILESGGKPSFKMVKGYNWSICACVNDVVVHGIPNDYLLKEGDVIGIDCGIYLDGFHTDHAWTKKIDNLRHLPAHSGYKSLPAQAGKIKNEVEIDRFLSIGEDALKKAILQVQPGNYIYDISKAIQGTVEAGGYSVVRSLVGHGVGRILHEAPEVPGFVDRKRESYTKIVPGMVLAIEIIYNLGSPDITYKGDDGWTISTKDSKISGLFEVTVGVSSHGGIVLT